MSFGLPGTGLYWIKYFGKDLPVQSSVPPVTPSVPGLPATVASTPPTAPIPAGPVTGSFANPTSPQPTNTGATWWKQKGL